MQAPFSQPACKIEDYALIGDCETAALVGRNGSIDWLCWPRFDSGACFAALLGTPDNGLWRIAPVAENARVSRRYRPNTLILETEFATPEGEAVLIDFMPLREHASHVMRLVVGKRGSIRMRSELIIRFDYGASVPWVRRTDNGDLLAISGPDMLVLRTPVGGHVCRRRRFGGSFAACISGTCGRSPAGRGALSTSTASWRTTRSDSPPHPRRG